MNDPRPIDEAALAERCRHGDLEAFNELVAAYQDRIYNLCLRMLGSQQAAEDATQDAFVSAYKNSARIRGDSVRPWLLRIASNICIDELRRRKRQGTVSIDTPGREGDADRPFDVPDRSPGPEQSALRGELGRALSQELARLPDDQRLAVVLCDVEGMSYEEIASAMGSSVGTVKSRISRGRARLREAMRAQPELFGDLIRPTDETVRGEERLAQ
jgi:RNA polymerase sigma-70 factor (ECF subfamily)